MTTSNGLSPAKALGRPTLRGLESITTTKQGVTGDLTRPWAVGPANYDDASGKTMKVLKAKADTPATRKRRRSGGAGKAYDVFAGLTTSSAAFSFLVTVLTKLVAAHCGKSGRHSQNQWRAATLPKKSGSTGSFARRVAKTRPCTVCRAPCQMLCRQCRLPHCRHHLTGTNGEELRCSGCDARRLQPPIFG